jgi:hypothetical protein
MLLAAPRRCMCFYPYAPWLAVNRKINGLPRRVNIYIVAKKYTDLRKERFCHSSQHAVTELGFYAA